METDRHYFLEGLFIIVFSVAAAIFAVWLGSTSHSDDVLYRIHFPESVNGLTVGDTVKFRGVDVGTVKSMMLDPDDPRLVLVEVSLRKEAPVKTDTRASLVMKGITGVVAIELNGGAPEAKTLLAATPQGTIPEIPSEKTGLAAMLDKLPKVVDKLLDIQDQTKKVITGVDTLTKKIHEDPSVLVWGPKKEKSEVKKDEVKPILGSH